MYNQWTPLSDPQSLRLCLVYGIATPNAQHHNRSFCESLSLSLPPSLSLSLSLVCKPHLRYTPLPPYFSSSSLTCEVDSLTVPFHWSYSFSHFILFFILPYLSFVFTSRPYTSDGLSHGVTYHIPCYSPFIIIRTRVLFPSPSSIFYLRPLCYISHHRVATPVFRLPVVLTSPT